MSIRIEIKRLQFGKGIDKINTRRKNKTLFWSEQPHVQTDISYKV